MNNDSYDAFYNAVDVVDAPPVRFEFTEDEASTFGIEGADSKRPFGGITFNLSKRGYPYLRAALIFQLMERKL